MIQQRYISASGKAGVIHRAVPAPFTSALIVFVLISWSVSAAPAGEKQDRVNAVAQIRSVLRAQQDAWNRGDIDAFMNGYARSRSTIFVSEDTVRRGWETVRARYRKKYSDRAKMGLLAFSDLEITPVSSEAAVVLGRWNLKRTTRPAAWSLHLNLSRKR